MTIQELYDWACKEEVENCDIVVLGIDGCKNNFPEPYIEHHKYSNGIEYIEIELL